VSLSGIWLGIDYRYETLLISSSFFFVNLIYSSYEIRLQSFEGLRTTVAWL
jgi:hypothetical protein